VPPRRRTSKPSVKAAPPTRSRAAILDAALAEFAERGFDGVRMEHVAKRAGFNKALVYRHFGDKRGLFDAALRQCFMQRKALLDQLPGTLAQMLVFWSKAQRADRDFLTIIQREALQDDGGTPVEAAPRRAYYSQQVGMLKALQDNGEVDSEFDPEALFLALLGVTVVPVILPQIGRLVTGLKTDGAAFRKRWERTLVRLAGALSPRRR
jgi:AcrR family transcriptional regulator